MDNIGSVLPALRQMTKQAEELYPSVINRMYPRNYAHGDRWPSPRMMAGFGVSMIAMSQRDFRTHAGIEDVCGQWAYLATAGLAENEVPTWFVSPELVEGLMHTDLPHDLSLNDLRWPREAILFVLPTNSGLRHSVHGDMAFLVISHTQAGTSYTVDPMYEARGIGFSKSTVNTFTVFLDGAVFAWSHPINEDLVDTFKRDPLMGTLIDGERVPPGEEDKRFTLLHSQLAIGLMLALQARPDLEEPAVVVQKAKQAKPGAPQKRDLWSPRYLGRKLVRKHSEPQGGTHASPTTHWRRGVLRILRVEPGKPWKANKEIWIEPTLVNR